MAYYVKVITGVPGWVCGGAVIEVRLIQVIETNLLRRGAGVLGDPLRIIRQFWSLDGELLAEADPIEHLGAEPTHLETQT